MSTLYTSAVAFAGGSPATTGSGDVWLFQVVTDGTGGNWAAGDKFTVSATVAQTQTRSQTGFGTVSGLAPSFAFTFCNKLYLLIGSTLYYSANGLPIKFNDINGVGNSFISLLNWYSTAEDLTSMAPYQGGLLVTSRQTTQIWTVDPDPQNYALRQTLANVGTRAPFSVAAVGEMDVYMLYDSGVRSIRVRDASNNAIVSDVGVPIDSIVQGLLAVLDDDEVAASCSVIEPSSNRYWLFIPGPDGAQGTILVYSSFPTSNVAAWATYAPTYNTLGAAVATTEANNTTSFAVTVGGLYYWTKGADAASLTCGGVVLTASGSFTAKAAAATAAHALNSLNTGSVKPVTRTAFAPERICVLNGRVYLRGANGTVYLYGGADGATYENCGVQADTPFFHAQSPATRKQWTGADAACEGSWSVSIGVSPASPSTVKTIYANTGPSFERSLALAAVQSTHAKLRLVESGDGYARFSSAIVHYQGGDEK